MPLTKFARRKNRDPHYKGLERRGYSRLPFDQPLRFKVVNPIFLIEFQIGKSKNISENGMLFKTVTPPPRKSYILIETDQRTLIDFLRADHNLVLMDHKILGKVMRTHLNLENGLFEVGVRFVHPTERNQEEVKNLLTHV